MMPRGYEDKYARCMTHFQSKLSVEANKGTSEMALYHISMSVCVQNFILTVDDTLLLY